VGSLTDSVPLLVRGRNATSGEFLEFATALDLSAGGVLLAILRYVEPGTEISLKVPTGEQGPTAAFGFVLTRNRSAPHCGEALFPSRAAV